MIVQRFVQWRETANSAGRAEAARAVAKAFVEGRFCAAERIEAEATLTLMLDDPSPKVRQALAEGLATARGVPPAILQALCEDSDAIACPVAQGSPMLTDEDLITLVAIGSDAVRRAVVARPVLSVRVSAAIAEVADPSICVALLDNEGAAIAGVSYQRLAERHGQDADVRGALLARRDLPATVRQTLILAAGQALADFPLLRSLVGPKRAEDVAHAACEKATARLAEIAPAGEIPALVEHLRASGQLTAAFLLRSVSTGHIDLLGAALARLSQTSERRVAAVLAGGRQKAVTALIVECGLPASMGPLFWVAVTVWREIAAGKRIARPEEVPQMIMRRVAANHDAERGPADTDEVTRFLHRLAGEAALDAARERARRLAA
ncbi:DUF2336 domain-containing protein [Aurantimonas endophytica]|uniref:Uncharacterized protein (DUF2336 family) n=1 Tax=Aurantimonas endophytica TaxID=1522175 RepID=A0A7W6MMZ4_9HYPH|nr:DUF2336 domain-containing protein [Aurantimonas endophytica]MBB4001370.1 uncharacterized protein (DUF2336 family) [Aurantimonas endophytica]MCO6402987.1 DUF2336 domain-containing protein [Aurantimonas endophytica]